MNFAVGFNIKVISVPKSTYSHFKKKKCNLVEKVNSEKNVF
jgi:hypothetical protein